MKIPPGWMLVPVEATNAMCVAAVKLNNGNAVYKNVTAAALEIEEQIYAEVYEAMIAAAPPPVALTPLTDAEIELLRDYAAADNAALRADNTALQNDVIGPLRERVRALHENGDRLLAVADSAVRYQREMVAAATAPLHAQIDALQGDAERYRWLRDQARSVDWTRDLGRGRREWHCRIGPLGMDAAIDAARGTP